MNTLFGVILPYCAIAIFILGMLYRVIKWGRSAVPFRIPTTCGQEKSLPWIKASPLDNPYDNRSVVGRMLLEILIFRSLWRNTRTEVKPERQKLIYGGNKFLWLFGLLFHWSLLIILVRHLRLFIEPVPWALKTLEDLDGAIEILIPTLFLTDIAILLALTYLFLRRVAFPQIRYISLPADYFALLLLLGVATTGVCLRIFFHTDVVAVKELAMSVLRFDPKAPEGISWLFYCHLTMVSALLAYFPFSKMVHMGGIFFSPTRNLANNNRAKRHVNPWDYPVKVHPYHEYEDEFRKLMKGAGL
ncbi:MAG: menaquinol oxidoreductase, partial [Chloroflexi bacterium]|nr:menaquinol oxidoreductase [Chloroflexota bacterium]